MDYHVMMYAVMNAVGLLAAFIVSRVLRFPRETRHVSRGMFAAVLIGAILGSKIPVWLSYGLAPQYYWDGKSLFGGLIGGFLAMNLYKAVLRIPLGGFGDRFVIPLCIAVGFGKIGCYLHGCCGGREINGIIHPTQLYESGFQFFLAICFYTCYRFHKMEGYWFPLYMMAYMVMRFGMEFLRNEPSVLLHLTIYQWISLFFLPVFCIIVMWRYSTRKIMPDLPAS